MRLLFGSEWRCFARGQSARKYGDTEIERPVVVVVVVVAVDADGDRAERERVECIKRVRRCNGAVNLCSARSLLNVTLGQLFICNCNIVRQWH